ncbi:hypothetical protein AB0B83_26575 [Micromonospora sp. NPDC049060]|uniref:hypothetical protein n=1 Tax=Micromonospora sp. NPDC049060 TaxID=3154828 RepID=UPI0033EABECA
MTLMAENPADELAILVKEDFTLPVTDAFITKVHRGVRRRRMLRAVAAGGAVTATAIVATLVVMLAGPTRLASPPGSITDSIAAPSPTAGADSIHQPLDGYRVTFVPDGLQVGVSGNGSASYAVSKDQLHNDGSAPASEHPTAATTLRTYVLPNGSNRLSISVLRPERTTAKADRVQVTEWLTGWAIKGAEVIARYELPAGRAQLTRFVGSEVIAHNVVITTPDGAVIVISGNGAVPVADLKAVAAGILPQ